MTISSAAQFGIASLFFLTSAGDAAASLHPETRPVLSLYTPISAPAVLYDSTEEAISLACENPSIPFEDVSNFYVKVDDSNSAIKIPLTYIASHWNPETKRFPLPENPDRVLCPV